MHCHCYSPIKRLDAFLSDQNEKCDDDPPLFDEKNTVAGDNLLLAEQRHPQAAKTMRWMWKEECLKNRDPRNIWKWLILGMRGFLRGLNFETSIFHLDVEVSFQPVKCH